jgi:hypothetical protein
MRKKNDEVQSDEAKEAVLECQLFFFFFFAGANFEFRFLSHHQRAMAFCIAVVPSGHPDC